MLKNIVSMLFFHIMEQKNRSPAQAEGRLFYKSNFQEGTTDSGVFFSGKRDGRLFAQRP